MCIPVQVQGGLGGPGADQPGPGQPARRRGGARGGGQARALTHALPHALRGLLAARAAAGDAPPAQVLKAAGNVWNYPVTSYIVKITTFWVAAFLTAHCCVLEVALCLVWQHSLLQMVAAELGKAGFAGHDA